MHNKIETNNKKWEYIVNMRKELNHETEQLCLTQGVSINKLIPDMNSP